MPATTYTALAKTLLTSDQADVTFSSISSAYTDLVIRFTARGTVAQDNTDLYITINGSSSSIYGSTILSGYSTFGSGYRTTANTRGEVYYAFAGSTASANAFGGGEIYIPNYANTTINKSMFVGTAGENNTTVNTKYQLSASGISFSSTAAISSIKIALYGGNIASGSRFDLYGIKNT